MLTSNQIMMIGPCHQQRLRREDLYKQGSEPAGCLIKALTNLLQSASDMEFVTSGTSGTCVKYFWPQVKFQELTQKLPFLLNRPNSGLIFHLMTGAPLYLSSNLQND